MSRFQEFLGASRLAVSTAWAVRALSATALADLLLAGHIGRRSLEQGQQGQGQQGQQGQGRLSARP